jgi:hypothetical protein
MEADRKNLLTFSMTLCYLTDKEYEREVSTWLFQ